jgi:uncharacterized protein YbjT (DUF2867 family)
MLSPVSNRQEKIMNNNNHNHAAPTGLTLVLGGNGKTGRRIISGLEKRDISFRLGSRSAEPPFDWDNEAGWDACLQGVTSVYLNYAPDLAIPGAADSIRAFTTRAKEHGVRHIILLSGRGEEEASACEKIVQGCCMDWTIVRASWFYQNFSEGAFIDMVLKGQITLPAGDTPEPFVDVDDIADVVVTALTEAGHAGEVYEVTGPRLMTFADIAAELSQVTGRAISYMQVSQQEFVKGIRQAGTPEDITWLLDYLFSSVLDGRNAYLTDGIERALGRPPRDFTQFAMDAARAGAWTAVD